MNTFEQAANEIENDTYTGNNDECGIEWLKSSKIATVQFPSKNRFNSKVRKLAEQYPDEVEIYAENPDGSIVAHIPVSYIKISHPRQISDEQKQEMAMRMRKHCLSR